MPPSLLHRLRGILLPALSLAAGLPLLAAQALPYRGKSQPTSGVRGSGPPQLRSAAAGTAGVGPLTAWGSNDYGQMNLPAGAADALAVAAGLRHTLVLKTNGTVIAVGDNSSGQCNVPDGLSGVVAIDAGAGHSLALRANGTVVGWGGALGSPHIPPGGLSGVVAIAAGSTHSLALKDDGTVVAWGNNLYGQISTPAGLSGVVAIAAGGFRSIALKANGMVVCWGDNSNDAGTTPDGLSNVMAISAGFYHNLALKTDGTVVAWGSNSVGQCSVPAGLSGVKEISAGPLHSVALKADGTVVAWGLNASGQSTVPGGLSGVSAIAAGQFHTVALRSAGRLREWEQFGFGVVAPPAGIKGVIDTVAGDDFGIAHLSNGTLVGWRTEYAGVDMATLLSATQVRAVSAGYDILLAIHGNGNASAWGRYFEDGVGYHEMYIPAAATGLRAISNGANHALALKGDGTVINWGEDAFGSTVTPGGLSSVKAVVCGTNLSAALRSDGTVAAWGYPYYGATDVPAGLKGVKALAAGTQQVVALKSDGTVVAWGDSGDGEAEVPPGLTNVRAICAVGGRSAALKADGTVVTWGPDYSRSLPDAASLFGVLQLAGGYRHSQGLFPDQAPMIDPPGTLVTLEDTPGLTSGITVVDQEDGSDGVSLSASANPPGLVQSFAFSGSGPNRNLTITPAPDQSGTATITLTASDGYAQSTAQFQFVVTPVNDRPSYSLGLSQFANEDAGPVSVPGWATNLSPGPVNEAAQHLTFQLVTITRPELFSVAPAINPTTGELTYTPAANANGTSVVAFELHDDGGTANGGHDTELTVRPFAIRINAVNDAPVATSQGVTVVRNLPKSFTVTASDVDGDALTYLQQSAPAHGLLSGTFPNFTYTPAPGYEGSDSLSYKVKDPSNAESSLAFVVFGVISNQPPTVAGDSYAVDEDGLLSVSAPGVLGNDADPEGQPLTAVLVDPPTHGNFDLAPDGSLLYGPFRNYSGPDYFTYRADDGNGQSELVTVLLTVSPVNDAPFARVDLYHLDRNTTLNVAAPGVLENDLDADGDTLTSVLLTDVSHGSLTLNADGSFRYTPVTGFKGQDSFAYLATDPSGATGAAALVLLTVNAANTTPTAMGDGYTLWKNTTKSIAAPGVLVNDTDADGDALTAALVTGVSHGSLTLNADGSFSYTPAAGYAGADSFTYSAHDPQGAASDPVTVTLTVQNDATPPSLVMGSPISLTGPARLYVPVTVTDGQSGVVSVQLTTNSSNVVLRDPATGREVPPGGTLTFDPALASLALQAMKQDLSRSARVELRAMDASGNTVLGDPVIANLEVKKRQLERTYRNLPRHEHYLSLENGTPGLTEVKVWVNGKRIHAGTLADGAVLRLDAAAWMTKAKNTVRLVAEGPAGATAVLLIGDQSLAGSSSARSGGKAGTTRRELLRLAP